MAASPTALIGTSHLLLAMLDEVAASVPAILRELAWTCPACELAPSSFPDEPQAA